MAYGSLYLARRKNESENIKYHQRTSAAQQNICYLKSTIPAGSSKSASPALFSESLTTEKASFAAAESYQKHIREAQKHWLCATNAILAEIFSLCVKMLKKMKEEGVYSEKLRERLAEKPV
jgi:hypothetical protein